MSTYSYDRRKQAMEFDTEKALKTYLREHPGADRSNHSVKKKQDGAFKTKPDSSEGRREKAYNKFKSTNTPASPDYDQDLLDVVIHAQGVDDRATLRKVEETLGGFRGRLKTEERQVYTKIVKIMDEEGIREERARDHEKVERETRELNERAKAPERKRRTTWDRRNPFTKSFDFIKGE